MSPSLSSVVTDTEERYEYLPLPPNSAEHHVTRILQLLPDKTFSAPVRCELEQVSLDEKPSYEAISYCWGDLSKSNPILCHGKRLDVSPSLAGALRHLRRPDTSLRLWADAICISQHDILERSQQVKMMRNIFEGAKKVLVWLGEADADSRLAISLIESVEQACRRLPGQFDAQHITMSKLYQHGLPVGLVKEGKFSLKTLLWRPWFQRVWIIQEVAVAQEVTLKCGQEFFDWDVFIAVLRVLDAANVLTTQNSLDFEQLGFPNLINRARWAYQGMALSSRKLLPGSKRPAISSSDAPPSDMAVLSMANSMKFQGALGFSLWFRRWSATDPRDKIFAICGLTEATESPMCLEVDYTKSVSEIYHNFAANTISTTQSLDILSTPRCRRKIVEGLPSWVPDWSAAGSVALVGQLSARFRATKNSKHHAIFSADQNILVVNGEMVDKITKIGLTLDHSHKTLEQSSSKGIWYMYDCIMTTSYYQKVLAGWERLIHEYELENGAYITGEDMATVYKQTLAATHRRVEDTLTAYERWQQDNWPMRLLADWNLDGYAKLVDLAAVIHLSLTPFHDINFRPRDVLRMFQLSQRSSHEPWFPQRRSFERYLTMAFGRKLARTENGFLALVPAETVVGDSVALFKGSKTPLIMRPLSDSWELIGDSYIHGIMNGEVFNEESCHGIHIS